MTGPAGGLGDFGKLFGKNSTAEQFLMWGVVAQFLGPLLNPFVTELGKLVNSATPVVPITPSDAANLVSRGLMDQGTGEDAANDAGIAANDFAWLVKASEHAPDLGAVIAAYQRGLIDDGHDNGTDVSLSGALTDAGIRAGWHDVLAKLTVQIPSIAEVMNAWLEGQIDEPEARKRYLAAGGDPTWFQTSYNANGEAPTPVQALELLNRGIIPERGTGPDAVSYEQAFLEGPWRNKWLPAFIALREYLPPPRTVTAMYHAGQIDHGTAAGLLMKQGLSAELATAYLSPGHTSATVEDKQLAKTDVLAMYADALLSHADAVKALVKLRYSEHDAALILKLQDVRTAARQVTAGVTRTRTLFNAGKLSTTDAIRALLALGVSHEQAVQMTALWAVTDVPPVRALTESQIVSAWAYDLLPTPDALAALVTLGYDDLDAWLLLSIRNKGALKDAPRPHGGV